MQENKINVKGIAKTVFLIFLLLFVVYTFIGILISGPMLKKESEEKAVIAKITNENKGIENIEKNIFEYVTYTGEDNKCFVIFDEKGNRLAIRYKKDAKFDEVKQMIENEYPGLKDVDIKVGYGKNQPAYIIEKGYEKLIINYDSLRVVFYMKEGE